MFTSSNQVETRITRMFWSDGLLDLLGGAGVLLIGGAWQLELVPLGALAPAMLAPFWRPLRARITEPRLGYVELSAVQQQRHRWFLSAAAALGAITLLAAVAAYLVVVSGPQESQRLLIPALPVAIFAVLALMTAAVTRQGRFVLYAVLFAICGAVVAALQLEPGWGILGGGLGLLAGGIVMVRRFIAQHPLPVN